MKTMAFCGGGVDLVGVLEFRDRGLPAIRFSDGCLSGDAGGRNDE